MEKIVSNHVSSLAVEAGAIHLRVRQPGVQSDQGQRAHAAAGGVEDTPVVPLAWVCGFAAVPGKMIVKGANRTDVPPCYLAMRCR